MQSKSTSARVAVYYRMSKDTQDKSIDRQKAGVVPLCRERGYHVVAVEQDEGISGSETGRRPGLQRLLALVKSKKIDGVVVDDLDRLARLDLLELGELLAPFRRAGVWLETVARGRIDFDSMGGRLQLGVSGEANKDKLLKDARQCLTQHLRMAKDNGAPPLPKTPYGYRREPTGATARKGGKLVAVFRIVPDPVTGEHVLAIFRWYAAGRTPGWIAAELERRGVLTPTGNRRWRRATIRGILANPFYAGDVAWGKTAQGRFFRQRGGKVVEGSGVRKIDRQPREDWLVGEDVVDALVDRETFARCQARLRAGCPPTPTTEPGAFLLSRLLVCGKCGAWMTGYVRSRGKREPAYVCGNYAAHGSAACVRAEAREDDTARTVVAELRRLLAADRQEHLRGLLADRVRALRSDDNLARLRALEAAIEGKLASYRHRLLEVSKDMVSEVEGAIRDVRRQLEDARAELAQAEAADPVADLEAAVHAASAVVWDLEQALEAEDRPALRAALEGAISKVLVRADHYQTTTGKDRHRAAVAAIHLRPGTGLELFADMDASRSATVHVLHVAG